MNPKTEKIIQVAFPIAGLLLTVIGLNIIDSPSSVGYGYALVAGTLMLCTAYYVHFRNKNT
jgi:hypothetical protein